MRLIAAALAATSAAAFAPSFAQPRNIDSGLFNKAECRRDPAYSATTHLLLVDRTTYPNQASIQRWKDAVPAIVKPLTNVGLLVVVEPKENATQSMVLAKGCLEVPPPKPSAEKQNWFNWGWSYISGFFGATNDTEAAVREAATKIQAVRSHRKADIEFLLPVFAQGTPTRSDTELATVIVTAIDTYCSGRTTCDLYLFSDLLDIDAKKVARSQAPAPDQRGRNRARALISEFRPRIGGTRLNIHAWGFGRSDADPNQQLPEKQRTRLRSYWEAFFSELTSNSQDGSITISDNFG